MTPDHIISNSLRLMMAEFHCKCSFICYIESHSAKCHLFNTIFNILTMPQQRTERTFGRNETHTPDRNDYYYFLMPYGLCWVAISPCRAAWNGGFRISRLFVGVFFFGLFGYPIEFICHNQQHSTVCAIFVADGAISNNTINRRVRPVVLLFVCTSCFHFENWRKWRTNGTWQKVNSQSRARCWSMAFSVRTPQRIQSDIITRALLCERCVSECMSAMPKCVCGHFWYCLSQLYCIYSSKWTGGNLTYRRSLTTSWQ